MTGRSFILTAGLDINWKFPLITLGARNHIFWFCCNARITWSESDLIWNLVLLVNGQLVCIIAQFEDFSSEKQAWVDTSNLQFSTFRVSFQEIVTNTDEVETFRCRLSSMSNHSNTKNDDDYEEMHCALCSSIWRRLYKQEIRCCYLSYVQHCWILHCVRVWLPCWVMINDVSIQRR